MKYFTADPRDGSALGACNSCCCSPASARPGETDLWIVLYAPWTMDLKGPGLQDCALFEIEAHSGCEPGPNEAAVITPLLLTTPINTPLNGSLVGGVTNPANETLEFSMAVFGGASYGTAVINADGTYTYTPNSGFTGYDRFWARASVGGGKPMVFEVVIGVGAVDIPTAAKNGTPIVSVVKSSIEVDQRYHTLSFAVAVSPAARVGCVYRVQWKIKANTCTTCLQHQMCVDLKIVNC